MFRRQHIVVLLSLSAIGAVAGGCSEDTAATPQAIFSGRLEIGQGNDCSDSGDLFAVGDFGNQSVTPKVPVHPVKDGDAFGQGTLSVSCSVKAAGTNEFDIQGSINLSGATGGFFTIDGHFKASGDQANIHAIFSSRKTTNTYEETDRQCVVRFTTPTEGVANGRMWGDIVCPKVDNPSAGKTCQADAQFRFENCAQ